jgi:hypothetical protein
VYARADITAAAMAASIVESRLLEAGAVK